MKRIRVSGVSSLEEAWRAWFARRRTVSPISEQTCGMMSKAIFFVVAVSAYVSMGDGFRWINLGRNDSSGTFRIGWQQFDNTNLCFRCLFLLPSVVMEGSSLRNVPHFILLR